MRQRDKIAIEYLKKDKINLRSALKSKGLFLNMIVHDLRNPATQIKFAIELAMDRLNES